MKRVHRVLGVVALMGGGMSSGPSEVSWNAGYAIQKRRTGNAPSVYDNGDAGNSGNFPNI